MESVFWLVAFVLFTIGEAATVGLTSIWFAIGALASLISVGLGASIKLQAGVFLFVSGASMVLFRPMVKNYLKPGHEATNADSLVGKIALVTETVDNITNTGSLQIRGQYWSAISAHDVVIPSDTKVRILEIQGVKLVVERI